MHFPDDSHAGRVPFSLDLDNVRLRLPLVVAVQPGDQVVDFQPGFSGKIIIPGMNCVIRLDPFSGSVVTSRCGFPCWTEQSTCRTVCVP